MKRILPVALFGLLAGTLILAYLQLLNNKAGADIPAMTFTSYTHSNLANAKSILSFWRQENSGLISNPIRVHAVQNLVKLDYLLMAIYCFSLCFILIQLRKHESRKFIKKILAFGLVAVLIGTILDAIKDMSVYSIVSASGDAKDLRFFAYSKSVFLLLGGLSMFAVFVPKEKITGEYVRRVFFAGLCKARFYLSQLFKSIWVFFPGILFLLLAIATFWLAGQGKDIMVAFTDNNQIGKMQWNYSRIVFFLAISFWAYVSWYSSRIIFYIKLKKQNEPVKEMADKVHTKINTEGKSYPDITERFMVEFPRLIGNACFLILELAFLQSPMMIYAIDSRSALILLIELLLIFYFLNKWVKEKLAGQGFFRPFFYTLGIAFLILLIVVSFLPNLHFASILALIIVLHIIYILYTNLHRLDTNKSYVPSIDRLPKGLEKLIKKIMCFFSVPATETGYYKWFVYTCLAGIICYLLSINVLYLARLVGPFPFILLAFGVLLAFGNVVTAFSVKYKVNFHFILIMLAFVIGSAETHAVRLQPNCATKTKMIRPDLETYLKIWLNKNDRGKDSIDMYFVMSNGGASRSGYWTASVLGRIEDATFSSTKKFSDEVFCLSGTSGGGVGVAGYFASLRDKHQGNISKYEKSLQAYLHKDYFTFTFARLLGPDYFHYIFPFITVDDRAAKLEESFEISTDSDDTLYKIPFDTSFSSFTALKPDSSINYPLLFINTTRVQDGTPGIVTNLKVDSAAFNNRVDVISLLPDTMNITMATASILGARFPYLSPAGRIGNSDFVDGGYFDNSGAGVVQELIRQIVTLGKTARSNKDTVDDSLCKQIERIRFHVLHIVNSPIIEVPDSTIKPISPISNDLFAPILTILGAYDMQTTVNDGRLINYINDLKEYDSTQADYTRISLYKSDVEWKTDTNLARIYTKEPPYAMNWFMSDTTKRRIDRRLLENDSLKKVINLIISRHPSK